MSFDVAGVRRTVGELLAEGNGLRVFDFAPGTIAPPCAVLLWPETVTPADQNGDWDYDLGIRVVVPSNTDAPAQAELDRLVQLVIARVEGNHPTLAVMVRNVTEYGYVDLGPPGTPPSGLNGLAATVNVRVLA